MILFRLFSLIRIKRGLESNGGKGCTKCTEMASKHLFCAWLPYVSFNLIPDAKIRFIKVIETVIKAQASKAQARGCIAVLFHIFHLKNVKGVIEVTLVSLLLFLNAFSSML